VTKGGGKGGETQIRMTGRLLKKKKKISEKGSGISQIRHNVDRREEAENEGERGILRKKL